MMRGIFDSNSIKTYHDGHVVLDAQQQMAHVEQIKHQEYSDYLQAAAGGQTKIVRGRDPLLAEETKRNEHGGVLGSKFNYTVKKMTAPLTRHLIGGTFKFEKDLNTNRKESLNFTRDKDAMNELMKVEEHRKTSSKLMNDKETSRLESARSRLSKIQSRVGGGGLVQRQLSDRSTSRSLSGFTGRPQSASSGGRGYTARSNNQYDDGDDIGYSARDDNELVEQYFKSARDSSRDTRTIRPKSASSARSNDINTSTNTSRTVRPFSAHHTSRRSHMMASTSRSNTLSETSAQSRPMYMTQIDNRQPLAQTSEVQRLALTKPREAAALRAVRAERFLDEKFDKEMLVLSRTASAEASDSRRRPQSAVAAKSVDGLIRDVKNSKINNRKGSVSNDRDDDSVILTTRSNSKVRPGTAPSSRPHQTSRTTHSNASVNTSRPIKPTNTTGIPEGGNYKSVGTYTYENAEKYGKSQFALPWASHYHSYDRFPEKVKSKRERMEKELEDRKMKLMAKLEEVENELGRTRGEIKERFEKKNATVVASRGGTTTVKRSHGRGFAKRGTGIGSGSMIKRTQKLEKHANSNGGMITVSQSARLSLGRM